MKKKIGIGIDLGGSSIKYALGTDQGEILKENERPSHATEGIETIIDEISEAITEMVDYAKSVGLIPSVVGMGTPGSVDVITGFLERYASASAMIDLFYKKSLSQNSPIEKDRINVKYIFEQKNLGNSLANEIIEKSTYYLGRGIANFINIFNPTIVIIGGGVAKAGKGYLKKVENVALHYAMDCSKENVKIVAAKLGNKAGYMGALGFAFDQTTPLL
jgi:predicted NBD/HSP70 family sugar kinase